MELDVEHFNVHAALSSILSLIKERIKETGIIFTFDCPESHSTMVGDERRIKQAVLKLLTNAIEFTPVGGNITLGAKESEDTIIIWVEDTGEGIAIEDQQSVFNKFYRTESARIRGKGGAGLGLSVVKSFIELHKGRIELNSALGIGTKISCILPRGNGLLLAEDVKEATIPRCSGALR
jgi:signal transduction histidine kinase